MGSAGPAFLWGWVLVGLGTFLLCIMWSELSSHYPLAGVMYEWPRKISSAAASWWVGWVYLFAMMFQLAGIYFILPAVMFPGAPEPAGPVVLADQLEARPEAAS